MFMRTRPDIVEQRYIKLDGFVGEVQSAIDKLGLEKYRYIVLSDHGFRTFEQKVHLNHWLSRNGFMKVAGQSETPDLRDVSWDGTQAYAIGLNSLYLNVASREGQGIVQPSE